MLSFQLAPSMYMAYFTANQEAITVKYCVNKDAPEKKCNGKCHMRKQLKQIRQYKTVEFPAQIPDFNPVNFDWVLYEVDEFMIIPTVALQDVACQTGKVPAPSAGFYLITEPPPEC